MAAMLIAIAPLNAQQITVSPSRPSPGSIVRISLSVNSVASVEGELGGERLHFHGGSAGVWRAIGAIPVDASRSVSGFAVIDLLSGSKDTIPITVSLPVPPPSRGRARARRLSVSPTFTRPLDAETQARIDRENERAREIGRRSHDTPRMWTAPFIRPRSSAVTSRFGTGRMFNGTLAARHLGTDFRGSTGAPVVAANRGIVALVDRFFLAGNVIYIDHGDGVVTGYFHLSRALVAEGDTVARGQKIGLVGATGRVTGAHLHWSARYGALTVNPIGLVGSSF